MKSAVLVIDVQQGLCEGEGAAFDCEGTISRINATLTNMSSFGPRVQAVPSGSIDGA